MIEYLKDMSVIGSISGIVMSVLKKLTRILKKL